MNHSARDFRPDIQGLRAVAVLLVLAYHLWPGVVPGGYVGVDVFFVISGYLITGVLLADAQANGRIFVARFYARRIKRLLPAATCVLFAVALATPFLPAETRSDTAIEIAASAVYLQNYWLAHQARDYLAADDAPSAVQHYWSLAVEEQYYIVWPLLFWLATRLAPRLRTDPRAVFAGVLALLFGASLVHSVQLTAADASQAYFATTTRAWELALGGALSTVIVNGSPPNGLRRWRRPLGVAGLLCIASACMLFGARTPFPGYAALLPTAGACGIIAAGSLAGRWPGDQLLRNPLMVYVGGISYSLYLWHWPVQTLGGAVGGVDVKAGKGALIVLISVALAHATKKWVEDPCRATSFATRHARQPFVLAAACVAVSLAAAAIVHQLEARTRVVLRAEIGTGPRSGSTGIARGAMALDEAGYDFRDERLDAIVPAPARAKRDVPSAYQEGCYQSAAETSATPCTYGSADANIDIALIGDSHAVHWFPAFQELAARRSLRFSGLAKNSCAFSFVPVYDDLLRRPYTECLAWSHSVVAWLAAHKPHVVLISQSPRHRIEGAGASDDVDRVAGGMSQAWTASAALGLRVMAFASTPWFPRTPSECLLASHDWLHDCVAAREEVLRRDAVTAAATIAGAALIDLNDSFCIGERCPPVIGGALVYRDRHHITATYARTLAERVERALAKHGVVLSPR
jgi:peptidoglycan/LPS O-acetylase OafA/YrhL